MTSSPYVPDRGDIVWLTPDPQAGHEQKGHRPALTLSNAAYNGRVGLSLFAPITNKQKGYPFEVELPAGGKVTGVVLADQVKSLDWRARKVELADQVSEELVLEVAGKILPLLDPDEVFSGS